MKGDLDVIQAWSFLVNGTFPQGPVFDNFVNLLSEAEDLIRRQRLAELDRKKSTTTPTPITNVSLDTTVAPSVNINPSTTKPPALNATTTKPLDTCFDDDCRKEAQIIVAASIPDSDKQFLLQDLDSRIVFSCLPMLNFTTEDDCLSVGFCSGGSDCNSTDVQSDRFACEETINEATDTFCKWNPFNEWIQGKGLHALINAIMTQRKRAVDYALEYTDIELNQPCELFCNEKTIAYKMILSEDISADDPNLKTIFDTKMSQVNKADIKWCNEAIYKFPLDLAFESGNAPIISALLRFGAKSGLASNNALQSFKWDIISSPDDLTTGKFKRGTHGYLSYFPWWNCVTRYSKIDDALRNCAFRGFGDAYDDECDKITGEFCKCDGPFSPTSDFLCKDEIDPDTYGHRKVVRNKYGKDRDFTKKIPRKKKIPDSKKITKPSKVSKPSDCDWNPFTNLLFFIFCIILKVLIFYI
jgi:hypothetical protein